MDSRLRWNDKERSITTQLWVPVILTKCSAPRHSREGGNPSGITVIHGGSFLESTESSMPGVIFLGAFI